MTWRYVTLALIVVAYGMRVASHARENLSDYVSGFMVEVGTAAYFVDCDTVCVEHRSKSAKVLIY